jgi:ADP-ribose pyrophosphatase
VRRLRARNRRTDGTFSADYRVDVVDRRTVDAVAVLVHRMGPLGREILVRTNLRPAAYLRKDLKPALADDRVYNHVEEIVAGVLEPEDKGEAGILYRGAQEVWEEAGFRVSPQDVHFLGAGYFPSPGVLSEKIYLTEVDVTGKPQSPLEGDGSPLEEGASTRWIPIEQALVDCRSGRIPDGKTELAIARFMDSVTTPV